MPSVFPREVQEVMDRSKVQKQKTLPFLPTTRPHNLTPTSSTEDLSQTLSTNTDKSDFFTQFPYEIRRQILIEAFGDRIIHININFISKSKTPEWKAGAHAKPSSWKRKGYNCWSSICHRGSPTAIKSRMWNKPCDDGCHKGEELWCKFWPGAESTKCFIGIMGWLVSCRQAYLEGIDILLRTNTFHMSSNVLFTNLNRLLLPHRIATITSLELRWSLLPRVKGYDDFHALLSMTKTNFPRLQKLHISIEGELRHLSRSADSLAQVENLILKPIEQMIVGLPKLEMLEVALPLSLYDLKRFKVRGSYVEPGYGVHDDERLWTALQPSSSGESTDGVLSGYWVCFGQRDRQLLNVVASLP